MRFSFPHPLFVGSDHVESIGMCPCMAINVNILNSSGFLPDMILLTQCYYYRGIRLNTMKKFCLNVLTFPLLSGGCAEGLHAFKLFLKLFNDVFAEI